MRKALLILLVLVMALSGVIVMTACETETKGPGIRFEDDNGVHFIPVEEGKMIHINVKPEKYGYRFQGLYTKPVDGELVVDETCDSLEPFTHDRPVTLYPVYTPIQYLFIFNVYGEESNRTLEDYDSKLTPLGVKEGRDGDVFHGWYVIRDNKREYITDDRGNFLEGKDIFNKDNYVINLGQCDIYADLSPKKCNVTFYYGDESKTVTVDSGTAFRDILDTVGYMYVNDVHVSEWMTNAEGADVPTVITEDIAVVPKRINK